MSNTKQSSQNNEESSVEAAPLAMTTRERGYPFHHDNSIVKSRDLKHHDTDHLPRDHLAVELPIEPQSTAPSATITMSQQTVERDQRRTTCDHLVVTKDRLTTEETPHQGKKTADIHRDQFSS